MAISPWLQMWLVHCLWGREASFFLLVMQDMKRATVQESSPSHSPCSTLNEVSFIHFHAATVAQHRSPGIEGKQWMFAEWLLGPRPCSRGSMCTNLWPPVLLWLAAMSWPPPFPWGHLWEVTVLTKWGFQKTLHLHFRKSPEIVCGPS